MALDEPLLLVRNQSGLSERKIQLCQEIWEVLGGNKCCPLDISEASQHSSRTEFRQGEKIVYLGANVEPGSGINARSRMSELACLAHELAHAERFRNGYDRPVAMPDVLLDEAEASLHASFSPVISPQDRQYLIEDARDQLYEWLVFTIQQEQNDEN